MIRVVVETVETCPDGSRVGRSLTTFDLVAPDVEVFLRTHSGPGSYSTASVVGVEVLPAARTEAIAALGEKP